MCELFAMSSKTPSRVSYSLDEFATLGAGIHHNRDGWGIAYAEDRDVFLIKEPAPASDSPWVKFAEKEAIETTAVIAHVRNATRGPHTMENTHPFRRALGRHTHVFAHNGTLRGIEQASELEKGAFKPVGDTDSELAFCMLLNRYAPLYGAEDPPPLKKRFGVFENFCRDMKGLGPCNFLYYDGEVLFAHADRRHFEDDAKGSKPRPPGLHLKKWWADGAKDKVSGPGLKIDLGCPQAIFLASVPFDDEGWENLPEGAVVGLKKGAIVAEGSSV